MIQSRTLDSRTVLFQHLFRYLIMGLACLHCHPESVLFYTSLDMQTSVTSAPWRRDFLLLSQHRLLGLTSTQSSNAHHLLPLRVLNGCDHTLQKPRSDRIHRLTGNAREPSTPDVDENSLHVPVIEKLCLWVGADGQSQRSSNISTS